MATIGLVLDVANLAYSLKQQCGVSLRDAPPILSALVPWILRTYSADDGPSLNAHEDEPTCGNVVPPDAKVAPARRRASATLAGGNIDAAPQEARAPEERAESDPTDNHDSDNDDDDDEAGAVIDEDAGETVVASSSAQATTTGNVEHGFPYQCRRAVAVDSEIDLTDAHRPIMERWHGLLRDTFRMRLRLLPAKRIVSSTGSVQGAVDVALAVEVLRMAGCVFEEVNTSGGEEGRFLSDVILISGDGDLAPAIEEVLRIRRGLGRPVSLWVVGHSRSTSLDYRKWLSSLNASGEQQANHSRNDTAAPSTDNEAAGVVGYRVNYVPLEDIVTTVVNAVHPVTAAAKHFASAAEWAVSVVESLQRSTKPLASVRANRCHILGKAHLVALADALRRASRDHDALDDQVRRDRDKEVEVEATADDAPLPKRAEETGDDRAPLTTTTTTSRATPFATTGRPPMNALPEVQQLWLDHTCLGDDCLLPLLDVMVVLNSTPSADGPQQQALKELHLSDTLISEAGFFQLAAFIISRGWHIYVNLVGTAAGRDIAFSLSQQRRQHPGTKVLQLTTQLRDDGTEAQLLCVRAGVNECLTQPAVGAGSVRLRVTSGYRDRHSTPSAGGDQGQRGRGVFRPGGFVPRASRSSGRGGGGYPARGGAPSEVPSGHRGGGGGGGGYPARGGAPSEVPSGHRGGGGGAPPHRGYRTRGRGRGAPLTEGGRGGRR